MCIIYFVFFFRIYMDHSSRLTEPGVRSFLCGILKQCRDKKNALYSRLFNIGASFLFVGLLVGILYYKHRGKMPEEEKKAKQKKEEMYIIEKIKSMKKKKKKDQNLIITELPQLDSGFDVLHKNYYSV